MRGSGALRVECFQENPLSPPAVQRVPIVHVLTNVPSVTHSRCGHHSAALDSSAPARFTVAQRAHLAGRPTGWCAPLVLCLRLPLSVHAAADRPRSDSALSSLTQPCEPVLCPPPHRPLPTAVAIRTSCAARIPRNPGPFLKTQGSLS